MLAGIPKNYIKSLVTSLGPKKIIPCLRATLTWRLPKALWNTSWRKLTKSETSFECVPPYSPPVEDIPRLRKSAPLTETETRRLVSSLQNKSCDIDPVPAKVFQLLQDELIPIYTRIINLSLGQGEFAQDWKNSLVKPLLKKTGLDLIRKNYRPVSNLMYISKMVEKAALNQFNAHSD